MDIPHLISLIKHKSCNTVYHELYSNLTLYCVTKIFRKAGLHIWDAKPFSLHGGSIRLYGCHQEDDREDSLTVAGLLEKEYSIGLHGLVG